MAYSEPTYKSKDDDPTIAQIQVYADNNVALVADAVAFRNSADHGPDREDALNEYATFIHRGAWLVYATREEADGTKVSAVLFPYLKAEGVGDEVTLPDAVDGGAFHLDQNVPWMVPGRVYQVDGVKYCFEVPSFL